MGAILSGIKNWKTTLAGVITGVLTLASDAICDALAITDPASREQVRAGIIAVGVAAMGLLMRDADKTSEESGAK